MSNEHQVDLPDPEEVLRAAEAVSSPRVLSDYIAAIRVLRAKKFTFREIAEWLESNFGISADHNSVWRAYARTISDIEAAEEAKEDDERQLEEAIETADRNETWRPVEPTPPAAEATSVETKADAQAPKTLPRKRKTNANK